MWSLLVSSLLFIGCSCLNGIDFLKEYGVTESLKAVDTIGNYYNIIIIIKPYLVTSNGERLIV